jgi:hypothetical protein
MHIIFTKQHRVIGFGIAEKTDGGFNFSDIRLKGATTKEDLKNSYVMDFDTGEDLGILDNLTL